MLLYTGIHVVVVHVYVQCKSIDWVNFMMFNCISGTESLRSKNKEYLKYLGSK